MPTGFAAVASGEFGDLKLDSLGRAGMHKDGSRKELGCTSLAKAKRRAIKRVINRVRTLRQGRDNWIELPRFQLVDPHNYNALLDEVLRRVVWTYHNPTQSYRTDLTAAHLNGALKVIEVC